jgi:putative ABC transport system permease protein
VAKEEYQAAVAMFEPVSNPAELDQAASVASTSLELLATDILEPILELEDPGAENVVARFLAIAIAVSLLFMALPAINMANLNIGRILERAPEIGLRKAAGASTRVLIGQLVFENVVLCALGGLLAFAVAPIVLNALNANVFSYGRLSLNLPVLAAGFVFILIFGVISGAWPAWRMARLAPAQALRGLQHA